MKNMLRVEGSCSFSSKEVAEMMKFIAKVRGPREIGFVVMKNMLRIEVSCPYRPRRLPRG
jgi:hypothetical protein